MLVEEDPFFGSQKRSSPVIPKGVVREDLKCILKEECLFPVSP